MNSYSETNILINIGLFTNKYNIIRLVFGRNTYLLWCLCIQYHCNFVSFEVHMLVYVAAQNKYKKYFCKFGVGAHWDPEH